MNIFIQFPENFDDEKTILNDFVSVSTKAKKESFTLHYSKSNVGSFQNDNEECKVYLQSTTLTKETGALNILGSY